METREKKYKEHAFEYTSTREHETKYRGSICPPTCVPIGTLSSWESLVLTNMARLITKIHEELKLTGNRSIKNCSTDTLYDFFENVPSADNDIAKPIYQSLCEERSLSGKLTEES